MIFNSNVVEVLNLDDVQFQFKMKNFSIRNRRWLPPILLLVVLLISSKTWASPPNWTVNPAHFQFNMNVLARLKTNGVFDNSSQNLVGVFVGNELRGVATPILLSGSAYFFGSIYSNSYADEVLSFRVFVQSDDKIYNSTDVLTFQHNGFSGKFDAPFQVKICRVYSTTTSVIEPTCNGSSNGTIFSNPAGIGAPFTYLWSNGKTTKNINLLPAGTFTVTVTDAGGCISTKTTVLSQPSIINFAVNYVANAPGYDAIFTTSGGTGSFTFNRTGMPTNDFKVATDPVFDHLGANTTFVFKAKDAKGCLKSVIKKTPTSAPSMPSGGQMVERNFLEDSNQTAQLVVFPNPSDDILNVDFFSENIGNHPIRGQIFVVDLFGRPRFFEKIGFEASQTFQISVKNLPSGIYTLIFKDEEGQVFAERFLVEN